MNLLFVYVFILENKLKNKFKSVKMPTCHRNTLFSMIEPSLFKFTKNLNDVETILDYLVHSTMRPLFSSLFSHYLALLARTSLTLGPRIQKGAEI